MIIKDEWVNIRDHFNKSFKSNLHVSIASVGEDGSPTVTPIGSLFLNESPTGFYFEKYPSKLPKHAEQNNSICVLAVNSNRWFWLKSLWNGKFSTPPAIKLYGTLGDLRKANSKELGRLKRRMRRTKNFKGHKYLWDHMELIREIQFTKAEKIQLGKMTQ